MELIINIVLLFVLAIVVVQDLKERQISWLLIPALCICFSMKGFFVSDGKTMLLNGIYNSGFICIQLMLLTIYMSIKNKKLTNIINTYLGIGDVLFFIAVSICFSPLNYILFYIGSMILTLIGFVVYKTIQKNASAEIPLAGSMAFILVIIIIINMIRPEYNFYTDQQQLLTFMQSLHLTA